MRDAPKILVAEDDPACQSLYQTALADRNLHVVPVSKGAQALKLLQEGLDCSVMVVDYELPDMDGAELILRATRFSPVSTKIMISARKPDELQLGPETRWRLSHVLCKPIDVRQFIDIIVWGIHQNQRNLTQLSGTASGSDEVVSFHT